jgi:ribose-phosphate pyrophosphokinase
MQRPEPGRIMKVIGTETSQILAGRIADELKTGIVDVKFSKFPDGELFLSAGRLSDEVIIVGSVTDSDSFVQLLLLIDACEGKACHLVIPYMGYARQDKKFHDGEPVSARAIATALSHSASAIITVNIHDKRVLSFFSAPAQDISVAGEIGDHIKTMHLKKPLILAPDDGAAAFARAVSAAGNWDCDQLEKTRISGEEVRIAPHDLDVKGRSVVIVDDIISTGGTIATAASMLMQQGAGDVYAACVHGVLSGGAYGRLKAAGIRDVVCSDTIERGCSRFSAAGAVARAIARGDAPKKKR